MRPENISPENEVCELCQKNPGAYSQVRHLRVCEDCWQAMGRQEIAFQHTLGTDYTGQDWEAIHGD